jgi:hypothetical protein
MKVVRVKVLSSSEKLGEDDFIACTVGVGESDECAINRARQIYGEKKIYYITEISKPF